MKINKEGYGIIRNHGVATLVILIILGVLSVRYSVPYWITGILAFLSLGLFGFTLMFFRQPARPMQSEQGTVFAPADGKIVLIEEVYVGEYLEQKRLQVSVFMSVTNVHSNLYPVSGRISYFKYHPGKFLVAWHPKASEHNERTTTVIDTGAHTLLMRQIAGMVARRIVCYAEVGAEAIQNHKMGFIKFGSRVDLMLPLGSEVLVGVGDKVRGGQTPLAKLGSGGTINSEHRDG